MSPDVAHFSVSSNSEEELDNSRRSRPRQESVCHGLASTPCFSLTLRPLGTVAVLTLLGPAGGLLLAQGQDGEDALRGPRGEKGLKALGQVGMIMSLDRAGVQASRR